MIHHGPTLVSYPNLHSYSKFPWWPTYLLVCLGHILAFFFKTCCIALFNKMFINSVPCNGTNISPLRMQGNRGSMWIATTWVAYGCPRVSKELSWPLQHLINGHSYWKWCSFQTYSLLQWVTPINHSLMSFLTSASFESRGRDFSKGERVVTTQKSLPYRHSFQTIKVCILR